MVESKVTYEVKRESMTIRLRDLFQQIQFTGTGSETKAAKMVVD